MWGRQFCAQPAAGGFGRATSKLTHYPWIAGVDPVALAERLEAPLTTIFAGKGIFPESHPLWLWRGFGAAAPPTDSQLRESIRSGHAKVWSGWEAPADAAKVTPPQLLKAVQQLVGPAAVYTTDSGNGTFLAVECLRLDRPRSFLAPLDYSCMGYAVPAALGAALACPGRPVVSLAGDGAFLMTGLELLSAAQLGLPVMILLLRDRELAQIAQFQQTALGRKSCSELPDYDLPAFCRAVGVDYLMLSRNSEIDSVLRQASALTEAKRPVVVEVAIDYSRKTYFTGGVVRVNLARLPWPDRLRMVVRALARRLS